MERITGEKNPEILTSRVAVYLFLIRDNNLLLTRRYQTGWEDGSYTLISGHVDEDETITAAMIREAEEEAGIKIEESTLHVVHVMQRQSNAPYIDFFLTTEKYDGKPTIMEPEKCDDMQWFDIDQLPENTLPHVQQAWHYTNEDILFSEYGY